MAANAELKFKAGDYIFKEGDEAKSLFIVRTGQVAIRKKNANTLVDLAVVGQKEVIGELTYFDRKARSAFARALTDVTLLEIQFSAIDKIYNQIPDYFRAIISTVATRLRVANDELRKLKKEFTDE